MNERHSKGSLMLLEMLFVVFFFALVSAVYVQVFAGSKTQGAKSRNLSEATLVAQNLIEVFTEANGDFEETGKLLSHAASSQEMQAGNSADDDTSTDSSALNTSEQTVPSDEGFLQSTASPRMQVTANSITMYYNDSWETICSDTNEKNRSEASSDSQSSTQATLPEDATFTATLSVGGGAESTHLLTGRVTVANTKGERICELPVSLFLRGVER